MHCNTIKLYQGRIQDIKRGGWVQLNKIASSGGRPENFGGISYEKSWFYAKKSYFFQFWGGRACAGCSPPPGSAIFQFNVALTQYKYHEQRIFICKYHVIFFPCVNDAFSNWYAYWNGSSNSNGQQFNQYHLNGQPPLTSNQRTQKKRPWHMALEIQALTCNGNGNHANLMILQLSIQSVPIATKIVSLDLAHGKVL